MNKLDVINEMLASMGQASINSLTEENSFRDTGLKRLDLCQRRILSRGFWFNEEDRTLTPDTYGIIAVPNDLLELRNHKHAQVQYSKRGDKVYNRSQGTYVHEGPITVPIVYNMDFDELPILAADYIGAVAVYEFQMNYDADQTKTRQLDARKREAWVMFNSEEIRQRAVVLAQNTAMSRLSWYGPRLQ